MKAFKPRSVSRRAQSDYRLAQYLLFAVFLFVLSSWGETAHREINSGCVQLFPKEMENLKAWTRILGEHASDADFRKRYDKNEFVRHFIDIDNFPDSVASHKIEQNFELACEKYGKSFLIKNGTLPWSTDSTFKVLVSEFNKKDWHNAALTAANLGHYVADGFMPLHTVANYDGQFTGQKGVHARYEETLIDRYFNEIHLHPAPIQKIDHVQQYIFDYLYANNGKVNFLLIADKKAYKIAGEKHNNKYYQAFWDETRSMTIHQLEESSRVLASLIYTAWMDAGKPEIPKKPGLAER
jgi:hypothetical protein